jgi:hypothetical protein
MYDRESWGPVEADHLLARHGRGWITGCGDHRKGFQQ